MLRFRQAVRLSAFVTRGYAALAALARMLRIPGLATLGLLLIARAANAQLCTGVQSFARRPVQLRAVASFDTVARTVVGGVRIGGRGAFGDLELGSSHIKAYDASSFVVGAIIAYQVALSSKGRIQFCPAASVGFNIGPNNIQDSGVDYGAKEWGLGGAIGVLATHTAQIDLMPTLSFTFVHATQRLTDNTTFTTSKSRSFKVIDLGVGLDTDSSCRSSPSSRLACLVARPASPSRSPTASGTPNKSVTPPWLHGRSQVAGAGHNSELGGCDLHSSVRPEHWC